MLIYVLLALSSLGVAFGDYFSTRWSHTRAIQDLLLTYAGYLWSSTLWLPVIAARKELAVPGTIWAVFSAIATFCVGYFAFGERPSLVNWAGAVLAFISIGLLSR